MHNGHGPIVILARLFSLSAFGKHLQLSIYGASWLETTTYMTQSLLSQLSMYAACHLDSKRVEAQFAVKCCTCIISGAVIYMLHVIMFILLPKKN